MGLSYSGFGRGRSLNLVKKTILILTSLVLSACSSVPEKPDPEFLYQKDLDLEVNGKKSWGLAIPEHADYYQIKVWARDDHDYVDMKSCGRFRSKEDQGSKITFEFSPMEGIEDTGDCVIDIFSGGKENQSGWARVITKNPKKYNLAAFLKCNGASTKFIGTSGCDALKGLQAEITFEQEVLTQTKGQCVLPQSEDRKVFRWMIERGDCAYKFKVIGEDKWHVLFVSGFDRALYRGK